MSLSPVSLLQQNTQVNPSYAREFGTIQELSSYVFESMKKSSNGLSEMLDRPTHQSERIEMFKSSLTELRKTLFYSKLQVVFFSGPKTSNGVGQLNAFLDTSRFMRFANFESEAVVRMIDLLISDHSTMGELHHITNFVDSQWIRMIKIINILQSKNVENIRSVMEMVNLYVKRAIFVRHQIELFMVGCVSREVDSRELEKAHESNGEWLKESKHLEEKIMKEYGVRV